jgi:hypothetical protein
MNHLEKEIFKMFIIARSGHLVPYIIGIFSGLTIFICIYRDAEFFKWLTPIVFLVGISMFFIGAFGLGVITDEWLNWLTKIREDQKIFDSLSHLS